ncbi:tyrosine phosphatase family protein [Aquisalinus flavus]|uniref:Protein-tyrosine-phosphatase n=1 Tax=Aquisalinus flavus TaxID=1526572 RepID=A0A8J2V312_9PROT|nr:hypothetical protein [Aquisalinus flavus]MBD0426510.1 hypothetical protein [Aquisalinus flavus]UNE47938.1 hypothetical protein FF099_07700 [Aquisalinus flavus]GGD07393.1 protein-tyrosine-phosphatase [Aquisalinus flavus]
MIIISPYDRVEAALKKFAPDRVITIMDGAGSTSFAGIPPERHLKIGYTMAEAARTQTCAPHCDTVRIRQMIDFAAGNDWTRPLLVHCRLGLSRSPAAALIIQCALSPNTPERRFAEDLRTLSHDVEPSFMMLAQADDLLQRDGRMLDALDSMGEGSGASVGDVLRIPYLPEKAA